MIAHLLQSTIFAAAAALLTLTLRRNSARARFWIWLIASLKFLVPFTWLTQLGATLASRFGGPAVVTRMFVIVEERRGPLSNANLVPAGDWPNLATIAFALWTLGTLALTVAWIVRLRRVAAIVRRSELLESGREIDALQRLGAPARLEVRHCHSLLEPGVFGLLRPVLLLPAGIAEHLDDAQLDSILAHELCHVRHRDNVYASVHMLIEAAFWFHPLVWWLGARMVEERERACDEEVLRAGSEPGTYAESILKVCRFYLESPLVCVAGVTGADLRKRIEEIVTHRPVQTLTFRHKLLLSTAGIAALATPLAYGTLTRPRPELSYSTAAQPRVAALAPGTVQRSAAGDQRSFIQSTPDGRIVATNVTLKTLTAFAWNVRDHQISGGPHWLDSDRFDVAAASGGGDPRLAMRSLLESRFQLSVRQEARNVPILTLTVDGNGPGRRESSSEPGKLDRNISIGPGTLEGHTVAMAYLAQALSRQLGRTVVDRTGLAGNYDLKLKWTPDNVSNAVHEQLGLKLEPGTGPVDFVVVQNAQKLN